MFQSRVLATIGVTRGFGDHDLQVHDSGIHIKPFLTAMPEVDQSELHCPFSAEHIFCQHQISVELIFIVTNCNAVAIHP